MDNTLYEILSSKINKTNIESIIELLYKKTFNEGRIYDIQYRVAVNYYKDRKECLDMLKAAGIEVDDRYYEFILPCEFTAEQLNYFLDNITSQVNCNGDMFKNNFQHYTIQYAINPMNKINMFFEIPWQNLLLNPLWNTKEFAIKVAEMFNTEFRKARTNLNYIGPFTEIKTYQELNKEVVQAFISTLDIDAIIKSQTNSLKLLKSLNVYFDLLPPKLKDYMIEWGFVNYEYIINNNDAKYILKYIKNLNNFNEKISVITQLDVSVEEKYEILKDNLDNIF